MLGKTLMSATALFLSLHLADADESAMCGGDVFLIPPTMADYKLVELWNMKGGSELIKGKRFTVGGMVSKVLKSPGGPRIELFDGHVSCLPAKSEDPDFSSISKFYATGTQVRENKTDAFLDFLIKVVVSGEITGTSKPGEVDMGNCSVIGWYGVEVMRGRPKGGLEGVVPMDLPPERHAPGSSWRMFSRCTGEVLQFRIVAGRVENADGYKMVNGQYLKGKACLVDFFSRAKSPEAVSGRLFRSSGYIEGFAMNLEDKSLVKMDSDPLSYASEVDAINQIMKRKRLVNMLDLKMRAERTPGSNTGAYQNGIIDSWNCTDQNVILYAPPAMLGVERVLDSSVAIAPVGANGDRGSEVGRSLAASLKWKTSPRRLELDNASVLYLGQRLPKDAEDPKCQAMITYFNLEGIERPGAAARLSASAIIDGVAKGNPPASLSGQPISDEDIAAMFVAYARSKLPLAANGNAVQPPQGMWRTLQVYCAVARAIDPSVVLGGIDKVLSSNNLDSDPEVVLPAAKDDLDLDADAQGEGLSGITWSNFNAAPKRVLFELPKYMSAHSLLRYSKIPEYRKVLIGRTITVTGVVSGMHDLGTLADRGYLRSTFEFCGGAIQVIPGDMDNNIRFFEMAKAERAGELLREDSETAFLDFYVKLTVTAKVEEGAKPGTLNLVDSSLARWYSIAGILGDNKILQKESAKFREIMESIASKQPVASQGPGSRLGPSNFFLGAFEQARMDYSQMANGVANGPIPEFHLRCLDGRGWQDDIQGVYRFTAKGVTCSSASGTPGSLHTSYASVLLFDDYTTAKQENLVELTGTLPTSKTRSRLGRAGLMLKFNEGFTVAMDIDALDYAEEALALDRILKGRRQPDLTLTVNAEPVEGRKGVYKVGRITKMTSNGAVPVKFPELVEKVITLEKCDAGLPNAE